MFGGVLFVVALVFSYSAMAAPDVGGFVPKGWKIVDVGRDGGVVYGDLDKDGVEDAAFVIEALKVVSEKRGCGEHVFEDKSRPRTLMILSCRVPTSSEFC